MDSLREALGTVVARRRQDAGYSQEEFAYRSKVHRTYMTGIERGSRNPSLAVLERIATALGVALGELISDAEREHKRSARR